MEKLISKELLSEVLRTKIEELKYIKDKDKKYRKEVFVISDFEGAYDLSPIELAHKCKEWAQSKEYIIFSKNKECLVYSADEVYDVIECLNQYEEYFEADTEYEAIFKACQWILDNEVKYER